MLGCAVCSPNDASASVLLLSLCGPIDVSVLRDSLYSWFHDL